MSRSPSDVVVADIRNHVGRQKHETFTEKELALVRAAYEVGFDCGEKLTKGRLAKVLERLAKHWQHTPHDDVLVDASGERSISGEVELRGGARRMFGRRLRA